MNMLHLLMLIVVLLVSVEWGAAQSISPNLEYGRGLPRFVMWSPHGDQLLVVTQNGALWRYDARSLTTIDHTLGVTWAHYSRSGEWLFTQNPDETWAIRRADTPDQVLESGFASVWSLWDTGWLMTRNESGAAIRSETDPRQTMLEGLEDVYVSPDQQQILTHDPISGYVLRDGELTPLGDQPAFPGTASGVYWSPDGRRLAMLTGRDEVTIVPLPSDDLPYTLTLHERERFSTLSWSPDSTRLLGYDDMGNARIWDADSGQLLLDLMTGETYIEPEAREEDTYYPPDFWTVTWSSDGSHVFRCVSYDGDVYVICHFYDADTGFEVGQGTSDYGLRFDPARRYFILSEGVYDANSGRLIAPFEMNINPGSRVFSADNHRVAMASIWTSSIHIYDLDMLRLEQFLTPPPYLYDHFSMAWSPDGEQLVTWGSYGINGVWGSGLITLWNADTGTEFGRITDHVLFGQTMVFSSDSSRLAAADSVGNVAVFEAASGDRLAMLSGHGERVSRMAWQPGGDLLATTTGRSTEYNAPDLPVDGMLAYVWDTRTGDLVATLEHEYMVFAVLWHPTGRYLITDDSAGMSIWDTQTWTREQISEMSGNSVVSLSYQWTDGGNVLIRGHRLCSHDGGLSLNFFNFVTRHHVGPLHCSAGYSYEWNNAVGGILLSLPECAYTTDLNVYDCRVDVVLISTELPNTLYEDRVPFQLEPSYSFGAFAGEINLSPSPDNTRVVVMTDTELQMWQLRREDAVLLWSIDAAQRVVWNHTGDVLALFNGDTVRIVDAETGSTSATLSGMPAADQNPITWSADDAFLLVTSADQAVVIDAASGERVPLPDDIQFARWTQGFLQVHRPLTDSNEWWDVRTGRVITLPEYLPTVMSDDGRFGAEARTGVLRVWQFGQ